MDKKLLDSFVALGNSIAAAIPKIAIGALLIIVGLIFARLIGAALRTMLIRMRFDSRMKRVGFTKALRRIGLRQRLSVLLPKLAYFLIVFLLAKTASDAFGLTAISNSIGAFFEYLPNILGALLLLILGSTVGQFIGKMATQAAESRGWDSAPSLGKLVSALIIFLAGMMAIGQLKIDTEMVRIVTSIVLGAAALGFGLAFGLGTREVVRNIVTGFYTRKFLAVGHDLTIADQSGKIIAFTPTHTVLNSGGHEILVANAKFLEQMSVQQ